MVRPGTALVLLLLGTATAFAVTPVDLIAPERYWVERAGNSIALPYLASHPLDETHPEIERVIVMVHGSSRRATKAMMSYELADSLHDRPTADHTLVVCPQFLKFEDLVVHEPDDILFWWDEHIPGGQAWQFDLPAAVGDPYPRPFTVSSFELLTGLTDLALAAAPNASVLVFSGFSAGGKMMQHLAVASDYEDRPGMPHVMYLAMSQGHHVFLGPERPILPDLDRFAVPDDSTLDETPGYDTWPFGMNREEDKIWPLPVSSLLDRFAGRHYIQRIGEFDTEELTGIYQISEEANLQGGTNRLARMTAWWNHLIMTYGTVPHRFDYEIVEGWAHVWRIHRAPAIRYPLLDHLAPLAPGEDLALDASIHLKSPVGDLNEFRAIGGVLNTSSETRQLDLWLQVDRGLPDDPLVIPAWHGISAPGERSAFDVPIPIAGEDTFFDLEVTMFAGRYPDSVVRSASVEYEVERDLEHAPEPAPREGRQPEAQAGEPFGFAIVSVAPNPFNAAATMHISLPLRTRAHVELHDLLGRRVWTGSSQVLDPGMHALLLDGSALPSGMYIARLITGRGQLASRKVVLVR